MPFRRFKRRTSRRKMGNSVIHIASSMLGSLAANTAVVVVIASPSIFAGGSASSNIEAQDKDRTVNVGHHVGLLNLQIAIRNMTASGIVEFSVQKVERQDTTPLLGTFPIPTSLEVTNTGMQQATRINNPGKVFHFSQRAYTIEQPFVHKISVSPAKYRLSKMKAGDHWILLIHNRGTATVGTEVQMRYKEYE